MTGACAARPGRTVAAWAASLLAVLALGGLVGGRFMDVFTIPGSDAQRSVDLLRERFPQQAGDAAQVVFAVRGGRLDAGRRRAAVETFLRIARRIPGVAEAGDPFAGAQGDVSADGRIAWVDVRWDTPAAEVDAGALALLRRQARGLASGSAMQVEFTGPVIRAAERPGIGVSEVVGILVAVAVLVAVLGTLTALVPVLLAVVVLAAALAVLTLAAGVTDLSTLTPVLAAMLGLGVGIDYALFIVARFRQGLAEGLEPRVAAAAAGATAGRAVAFAGITVAVSACGLAVLGLGFITRLGLAAAVTVLVAVLAALTLLPAVLGVLGHRLERLRVPLPGLRAGRMRRWAEAIAGHPWGAAVPVLVLLAVAAIPLVDARLGASDAGTNPSHTTTRRAYDLLAAGFGPGFNGPLLVTVDQGPRISAARALASRLRAEPGVAGVAEPRFNIGGDTALVTVYPASAPQSAATRRLVRRLRASVIPAALAGTPVHAHVGGTTAAFEDLSQRIRSRMPLFLLLVVGVTTLVLTMAFRSLVVAVTAAAATVLSAMAAFGVLIAVFQWGWLKGLVGLDRTGPVESFLPVVVAAILFGLSMDYEVFLVSRIPERYVAGTEPRRAVTDGVTSAGPVVLAAALIMAVVFWAFVLDDQRVVKEFGVALGTAVLVDAVLVRLVVVPAALQVLGERAWWMPRRLGRVLPSITVEAPPPERRP